MLIPILATKLYIPPPRLKVVLRPRLFERLNEGLHHKLTLVSAPAGFGKTTLVSEWVASRKRPVAWLSLDEGDNDPARFLAYFVAALQTISANLGAGVLAALQSPMPPSTETILTALINEISSFKDDFILVLDDYHVIDAKPVDASTSVDDAITFLLEHQPPQMHLVLATREDPKLPLARLRARGQLTELRSADLRFTLSEAAGFLNEVMGLQLSPDDIAALEARTEGWIAGLQLTALSMQGREDIAGFIQAFTGSHRFVLDYLIEEVLYKQPETIQTFLLQTSILERMCGQLCDEVLLNSSIAGQETLERLERANLFVIPLDHERRWYRYHHLFADVLQARLKKEQPNQVAGLHLRACAWYEQNNFRSDAIRHALAAENFEWAADLIEQEWLAKSATYFQSATWLGWVQALPDELVRVRPWLSVGFAWELLFSGELEAAEARMRDVDRSLELTADIYAPSNAQSTSRIILSEEEIRSLQASLSLARAYHAQALGDVLGTVEHSHRVLTLVSEANHFMRGLASAQLGLACWTNGDLETAYNYMADAMAGMRMSGNLLYATSCAYVLAEIRIVQGRLLDAINIYEQALQLVTVEGKPVLQGTADLYLGLSELYRERGDLKAAEEHMLRSEQLGKQAALAEWPYGLYLAQARIKEDQGDLDGAIALLEEAEQLYHRSPVPNTRPVAALKARVWIGQGRLAEALGWAHKQGLSVDDELSYLHEFEHVTLARVLIACYKSDRSEHFLYEAVGLLERLMKAAEEGGRTGSAIEILVLQALAHSALGNIPIALAALERALSLAEPEGYVRVFVDEGIQIAELLTKIYALHEGGTLHGKLYIRKLLAALGRAEDVYSFDSAQDKPSSFKHQLLMEPLSRRELEVLSLLRSELTGPEISRELMVSLNTMRTHTKNIYNKLGVNNRRAAVRRAEELDLF